MFRLIFLTRLKCIVRDRQMMFWTFLFPLLLATLFGMAFENIDKGEAFTRIPVAVVDNAEYSSAAAFRTALDAVSGSGAKQPLFTVSRLSSAQAESRLKSGKIKGYVYFNGGAHVVVKESGIDQTILEEFVDDTLQTQQAVAAAVKADPRAAKAVLAAAESPKEVLRSVYPGRAKPDDAVTYYYALIAMASLYGGFLGLQEIAYVQANLSPQGARVSLAPVHKLRVFACSLCAATAVQFASVLLLIAYLGLVIRVQFGGNLPFILLASFAGSCAGVSLGAAIGAVVRGGYRLKTAVLIAFSMLSSFCAGLMFNQIKYLIASAAPALAYLNPGNLIADAFYALYYYTGHARFFLNVGLLFAFSLVFYLIVYFVMRRQKYESL